MLFLVTVLVAALLARGRGASRRRNPPTTGPWASPSGPSLAETAPPRQDVPPCDAGTATPPPSPTVLTGPAWVVDGDTIRVRNTQIRLFGVDAPEMNHPYGVRAKRAMIRLCKGQTIRAEVTDMDDHGRTVAQCFLEDGRDLSAELVKLGLAIDWPKFSGGVYRALETPDARRKLWLADARQKGRMHVWEQFEARERAKAAAKSGPDGRA